MAFPQWCGINVVFNYAEEILSAAGYAVSDVLFNIVILPNRIRGTAISIAVFALWAGCFTLTYTFPAMNRGLGPAGTFRVYALVCVAGFFVVRTQLPETKGKTLEQVERELH